MTGTVGDQYPIELERCKELRTVYAGLGQNGAFAYAMINAVIVQAEDAWESQDIVQILVMFNAMREFK